MTTKVNAVIEFQTKAARASLTRPANTTQYAAGDVISAVTTNNHFEFEDVVRRGPSLLSGSISSARIVSSANQATKLDAELWLFDTDIAEVADNSAFAPTDAEMLTLVGIIPFPVADWYVGDATSGAGGNAVCQVDGLSIAFQARTTTLYGQLVARNTYTPVSGEIFTVDIVVTQD